MTARDASPIRADPGAPRGRVLITGTSSGIGLACTLHLARLGFYVFAGVRSEEDGRAVERAAGEAGAPRGEGTGGGDRVRSIRLDVTDGDSIAAAARHIEAEAGGEGLCGLVNNAGISVAGPVEFVPLERWRRQFEVNLFGPVAVTQAMLPLLRQCVAARGKGAARVVMISSISGRVAQPVVAPYSASKFALEAVSDALRLEVKRQGVHVCVVAPGAIDTPIWRKEQQATAGLPAEAWSADLYGGMIEAIKSASRKAARAAIPPQRVADAVAACLTRRRPPIRTWVGWDAKIGAWFRNKIPDRWFDAAIARAMRLPLLAVVTWLVCLTALAAPLAAAPADDVPVTGRAEPKLEAFDRLMVSFVREHQVPGAALAVARNGRLVYARGFGHADLEKREPVEPESLFRIASVSKPFTAVAVLQLQERGKLRLDEPAFERLGLTPILEDGATEDPRLRKVTIRQLLHHTGGFDRDVSFDPMFRPIRIAKAAGAPPPARQKQIVQYMMGRPLDFDPGTREAYSNFGYCVLGRVIEKASGVDYGDYLTREVLRPIGIRGMRLGKSLEEDRAPGEVRYYPRDHAHVRSVFGDGREVPVAYGGWCIEAMDAHGGWLASAPDLARFGACFDDPEHCPILKAATIREMFARPRDTGHDKAGKPKAAYYACGWEVRPVGKQRANTWHAGLLDGTSSLLVRRYDGLTWAVLFNADYDEKNQSLADLIDPLLHPVADGIREWPER